MIGLSLLHSPHPEAFQRLSVRASIPCYRDFTLDKCRSLGFASASTDSTPFSGSLSLRRGASRRHTSPVTATRRLIMQKARRHMIHHAPTACRRMVSGSISPSSSECFSPFPHGTGTLSVSREYLALPDGPAAMPRETSRTGLSPATARLSRRFRSTPNVQYRGPTTPDRPKPARFGLLPVRSPLLRESLLFSLPAGTKMFQFPAFAP